MNLFSAQALWNYRNIVGELKERIIKLYNIIDFKNDLFPYQWAQLISVVLEFQPDLIIELGRGGGNSTCAFILGANKLAFPARVVSICLSTCWRQKTLPRIKDLISSEELELLNAYETNILIFNFLPILQKAKKILLFWDAHGFDIAECILGEIMPQLQNKLHIVVCHDMSDVRYLPAIKREYGNYGVWRGNNDEGRRVWLWDVDSAVEQCISIIDFVSRNKIELHSATHELHQFFDNDKDKRLSLIHI